MVTVTDDLLKNVDELPVLPGVLTEVLSLRPDDDDYFERLTELAERDPLFAARVITLANTARFAGRDPCVSVRTAVTRLGSRTVADTLVALAVMRVFVPRTDDIKQLWRHALEVANTATQIAAAIKLPYDKDLVYLTGLLHDVGRFVMLDLDPEGLGVIDESGFKNPEDLAVAETRICGMDHAHLGGRAANLWGLPKVIGRVISLHHQPIRRVERDLKQLVMVIRMADDLSIWRHRAGDHPDPDQLIEELAEGALRRTPLVLKPRKIAQIFRRAAQRSDEQVAALGL